MKTNNCTWDILAQLKISLEYPFIIWDHGSWDILEQIKISLEYRLMIWHSDYHRNTMDILSWQPRSIPHIRFFTWPQPPLEHCTAVGPGGMTLPSSILHQAICHSPVSDTDRAPRWGLPLPNHYIHWFSSYTLKLLPFVPDSLATSAQQHGNLLAAAYGNGAGWSA